MAKEDADKGSHPLCLKLDLLLNTAEAILETKAAFGVPVVAVSHRL